MKAALLPLLLVALSVCVSSKPLSGLRTHHKLLLVSFDGFRWDYDQDADTPNLDSLVKEGVKAKYITPPAITMTSPSHFTTMTGRWIEDHGVVHNTMFNDTTGLRVPHKETLKRSEWWDNGVLPLWITAQNQGLKTASFHFPGGAVSYSGQAVHRSLAEDANHPDDNETEWQQNIDTVMGWFSEEDFDFVALYYGEPDNVGHAFGPETPERRRIIQQIDRTIGYLRDAIHRSGLTDLLNVILTSDHGMTTVRKSPEVDEIKLIDYISFINLARFDLLDYGGFGMITPRNGKERQVYDRLKSAHPNLTVYRKDEIPEHLHIRGNARIQPIVLLADLGFNLNSRLILDINKGDHGYSPEEMDMKMIFRAFGPDFKKNFLAEPFHSVSIYPLMCKLLEIRPEANNGSLADTRSMLLDNSACGGNGGIKLSVTLLAPVLALLILG